LAVGAVGSTVLTLHGVGICHEVVAKVRALVYAKGVDADLGGLVILRRNSQKIKVRKAGVTLKRLVSLETTRKTIL
jgi:hypothetical protein